MLTLLALVDKFGIPTFVSSAALIVALPSRSVLVDNMSSRLVIPVLCVGAVAFACGPQTHSETSTPKHGADVAIEQQAAPRRASLKESAVDAQLYVRTSESPMRLALHIVNTGKKRVELTFPTGQTHDFVILDTTGREVWRWGNGRMFTQALRNKLLGAGGTLELEEDVASAALKPGRYTARAMLTSENYPIVQEAEFRIPAPTVASR